MPVNLSVEQMLSSKSSLVFFPGEAQVFLIWFRNSLAPYHYWITTGSLLVNPVLIP